MTKSDFDTLLTVSGAAEFLQLSESWLNKARISGDGPRFIKMGRSVRYSLEALEEFKRANARGSTSEYERRPGPGRPAKEKSGAAV
jgi:predicted DNA-binding transcriptional regulator AlpA